MRRTWRCFGHFLHDPYEEDHHLLALHPSLAAARGNAAIISG